MAVFRLEHTKPVFPQQGAGNVIHHELAIVGTHHGALFDPAHTGLQPGVQLRRSLFPLQREIVLFVKGNAPALAAGQTALCGEALKIIKAGGAQIPLHRDLRGGILRCRPVVKGLDMKFGAI